MKSECDNCQELQAIFDLQHTRTVAADKAWQKEHDRPEVIPDLGVLIEWLMKKANL